MRVLKRFSKIGLLGAFSTRYSILLMETRLMLSLFPRSRGKELIKERGKLGMKRFGEHTSWAEAENGRGEQKREWSRKSESAAVGERGVERNQVETTSLLRLTTYVSHQSAHRTGERSTKKESSGDRSAAHRLIAHWLTFTSITAMRRLVSRPAVASTNPILSIFPLSLFFYSPPPLFNSSWPPQWTLASQFRSR